MQRYLKSMILGRKLFKLGVLGFIGSEKYGLGLNFFGWLVGVVRACRVENRLEVSGTCGVCRAWNRPENSVTCGGCRAGNRPEVSGTFPCWEPTGGQWYFSVLETDRRSVVLFRAGNQLEVSCTFRGGLLYRGTMRGC